MRKKMRLIAMLSAMILSTGTMSVPAFDNTGENTGDGTTQAAMVQTQETSSQDTDNSAAGTTEKPTLCLPPGCLPPRRASLTITTRLALCPAFTNFVTSKEKEEPAP